MSKQLAMVVASRLNMQPCLISPAHGDMMVDSLRHLANADEDKEEAEQVKARADMMAAYGYSQESEKSFMYANGIAFIPVTGLLINRYNNSWGWVTGYNFIRSWLTAAVADPDVKAIVLDCNSGGGEVAGCFELASDILSARDEKPILAVVDSSAYSACYAIASAASKVVVTPSGGVGSIGVVAMHFDFSKMLTASGITVSMIYSGDHKVDGNPYEPLPEPVRASIQSRVDNTRNVFVALVAKNRGLDEKAVFDTQAACFTVSEALSRGLIDAVASPQEAVSAFLTELSGSQTKENFMADSANKTPGAESETATPDKANTDSATTTGESAGRIAERERIKAITTHDSAHGKVGLASHLAMSTDLSVEDAVAILEASAPENATESATSPSAFAQAMESSEHPNVGAGNTTESAVELTAAQRILQSQAEATGTKVP